jgi:hypothetical protein
VLKRGWAQRRQTSLTQAYKHLFPDTTIASFVVDYVEACLKYVRNFCI